MIGDTIDIDKDSKRYNELINQGMLPSQAIKKIETDKRLGIGVKPKEDTEWNITVVKIAIVGLIAITGYSIIKKAISTPAPRTPSPTQLLSIDDISGIDLESLSICRQNGIL